MKRDILTMTDLFNMGYVFIDEEGNDHRVMLLNDDTEFRIVKDHPDVINFVIKGKWYEDHILNILNEDPIVGSFIYNPGKNIVSVYIKEENYES